MDELFGNYTDQSGQVSLEGIFAGSFSSSPKGEGGEARDVPPSEDVVDNDDVAAKNKIAKIVAKCATSRTWFVENVLGATPEAWQRDTLEAMDKGETRVAIRSGNGVGKTCLCAWLALHYELFRNDVKVVITSPSSSQLRDGLIPEVNKWIRKLPSFLATQLVITNDRIHRVNAEGKSDMSNFMSFRTARKETPEALAGIHAQNVLCIVDEASGVHDLVFQFAQGTLSTPGAIFVMIGNPTRLNGYFHNAHTRLAYKWWTKKVSSFDTENVDREFVDTIASTYGVDSNQYRIMVLGEFPTGEDEALIDKGMLEAAVNRDIAMPELNPQGATSGSFGGRRGTLYTTDKLMQLEGATEKGNPDVIWGLDLGRGRDKSAVAERVLTHITMAKTWNLKDTMGSAGMVKELWDETSPRLRPGSIHVDSIGIGAGVADRLRELGLPAIDINVSESAAMKTKYLRLRDELWWMTKEWVETLKVCIVESERLPRSMIDQMISELSSPLEVYTSTGKNGVETKSQMRARGLPSPNIADAVIMTFAYTASVAGGNKTVKSDWGKKLRIPALSIH